ncbi:MAG: endolytic transglycosylase MltG [Actinobacteria bacterium]|nr:endolytic transglycosylase MltG [Actinomycetota bacterium]MCG2801929.1 endolytic transglycosylase MltG [Cellulomonas sp.]
MSDDQTHGRRQGGPAGSAWDDIVEPETATSATRRLTRRELREAQAHGASATPHQGAHGAPQVPGTQPGAGHPTHHTPGAHTAAVPQVQHQASPPPTARSPWSPVVPQGPVVPQSVDLGRAPSSPAPHSQTPPSPTLPGTTLPGTTSSLPPARPRWSAAPAFGQPEAQPPVATPMAQEPPAVHAGTAQTFGPAATRTPATPSWAALSAGPEDSPVATSVEADPLLPLALLGGDGASGLPPAADAVGHPHRRPHRVRSLLVLIVALTMVVGAGYVVWTLFRPGSTTGSVQDYPGPGGPAVQVVVNSGDTGADMAKTLHDAGVVATTGAFTKAYKANPAAASIQPGTYNLLLQMKASDAVAALLSPTSKASLKVTIPEGLTAAQILQKVSEKTTVPLADLQAAAANPAAIGLPAQAGGKVEGWLYPATYEIDPTANAASVLSQMVSKTLEVLAAKGVAADQQEAVLIKASLIEKEASRDEDRSKMARVIENRLAKKMPLQIDTATAYGLNKSAMDLTVTELADTSNPYNLRVLTGLPPTPISSPGAASIDAVIAPADGDWLFWVTINLDTGETVFTDNYADFQAAKKQYNDWADAHKTATANP